jgi:iron complex outermembrane receptor protein
MRHLFPTLWFIFIVNTCSVFAQSSRVSGIVTNFSGEPLSGAHVHLEQFTDFTDVSGNFSFSKLPAQAYLLKISHIGFTPYDTLLYVQKDVVLKITLVSQAVLFTNVTVFAKKDNNPIQETVLKNDVVEKLSHASFGDLAQEISGVSGLKTGSNVVKPIINGLHSSRVVIVQDGIRQEDQQWGYDHAPNIALHAVNEVVLVQGVKTLHYASDALGGLLVTKPFSSPKVDSLFGSQKTTLLSNGFGGVLSTSVYKSFKTGWYANLHATYKKIGDLNTPTYNLSNTGIENKQAAAGFGYRNSQNGFDFQYSFSDSNIGILRASHIGNISDLVRAINSGEPQYIADFTHAIASPRQESVHHFLKAKYYHWFENQSKITVDYGFQFNSRQEFDIRRGENRNRPAVNLKLATHSFQSIFENAKTNRLRFNAGISGLYQNNFSDTESTGVRALIPNYNKYETGVFASTSFALSDGITLETGIRYDYSRIDATKFYTKEHWEESGYDADFSTFIIGDFGAQWKTAPAFTYHNLAFASDLIWGLSPKTKVLFGLSYYSRNPNPAELFSDGLHHATGQIELGSLRLAQERAVKFRSTFQRTSANISWQVSPFIQTINDFMVLEPVGIETTIRGAFPVWNYKATQALLRGFDVDLSLDFFENWQFSTQLAVVYGDDLTRKTPLLNMPPARWKQNIRWVSNNEKPWEVSLQHEIVFTQKRFPNNDFEVNVPKEGNLVPVLVHISRPPAGYQLLDFVVNKSWNTRFFNAEKGTIDTGIVIQNLLNTQYRDYLNSMRFYADEMGRNILIQVQFNF